MFGNFHTFTVATDINTTAAAAAASVVFVVVNVK